MSAAPVRRQASSPGGIEDDRSSEGSAGSGSNKVTVICRVRCFNRREIDLQREANDLLPEYERKSLRSVVAMEGGDSVFLDHHNNFAERQRFPFDYSYWSIPATQQETGQNPVAGQEDLFRDIGTQIISNTFNAMHSCCFAYGQTGAGKSYSMQGTEDQPGLTPRICRGLFEELERRKRDAELDKEDGIIKEFRLEARFFEIYNEKVKDLLWALRPADQPDDGTVDRENIRVRHVGNEIQLQGLTVVTVDTSEDCLRLIDEGNRNRSVGATKMNDESSRSHSIFRLTLVQTVRVMPKDKFDKPKTYHRTATVSLVDLAGSERMKKTGAEGQRLKEAVAINQSLTTLKNVIDALVEGRAVVPYRDSTLTWILSDNLGGNSKTFMIACVSPHLDNADETLNTMRYALRTQAIVNNVVVNESDELRRMNRMREELARLQAEYSDGSGDSEYVMVKQRQEELRGVLERTRATAEETARNEAMTRATLEAARRQRYNLCYRNAFHRVFHKRANLEFTGYFARDTATLAGLRREVDSYSRDAQATDKEISDLRAEERRTQTALRNSEAELLRQKDRLDSAQAALRDLDKMEAANTNLILLRMGRLPQAESVAKQTVQRRLIGISVEREREVRKNTAARDALKEGYQAEIDALRAERAKKLEPIAVREARIAASMKADEVEHKKAMEDLKEKLTKLQSSCVFVENENRRSATEVDEQILQVNKERFEKFAAVEAAGKKRLQEYQTTSKAALAAKMEELRMNLSESQSRHDTAMDKKMERSRDEVLKINRLAEVEAAATLEECKSKLHRFQNLNADASAVLRSAKAAQKRYADMYEGILAVLRGAEPPEIHTAADEMDAVEDIMKRLQRGMNLAPAAASLASPLSPSSSSPSASSKKKKDGTAAPPSSLATSPNYHHASQTPLAFRTNFASPGSDRHSAYGNNHTSSNHNRGVTTPRREGGVGFSRSSSRTPSHTGSQGISVSSSRMPAVSTAVSASRHVNPVSPARGSSNIPRSLSQQQIGTPQQHVSIRSPSQNSSAHHHNNNSSSNNVMSPSHYNPDSPSVLRRKAPPVYQTATTKLRAAYAKQEKQLARAIHEEIEKLGADKPFTPFTGASRGSSPNRRGASSSRTRSQEPQKNDSNKEKPAHRDPWNVQENWYGFKSLATNEEPIPCSQRVVIEGSVIAMRTHTVVGTPRRSTSAKRSGGEPATPRAATPVSGRR